MSKWTGAKAAIAALVVGLVGSAAIGLRVEGWADLVGVYFFGLILLAAAVAVTIWIYGPPRDLDDRGAERLSTDDVERALEAAQTLMTAYSKVLQTPRDHFWPLSKLPADKEVMKTALKTVAAYWAARGELDKPIEVGKATLRDTYISTYAMLADFVPDDLAARVNPLWKFIRTEGQRIKAGEQVDEVALAQEHLRLQPSEEDERACERARDEWRVLADEMTGYLDRIAPAAKRPGQ